MTAEERARRISRAGVDLAIREWPSKGRPVVLLHGLASSSVIWNPVARELVPSFHVVAYDQRGHGQSGKPEDGYGFGYVIADLDHLIRSLRLDRPVVVGHSWGANVALEHAVSHPSGVAGIVLVDGGFLQMSDGMDWPTARRELAPPRTAGMPLEDLVEYVRTRTPLAEFWSDDVERLLLSLFEVQEGRVRPHLSRSNHLKILRALWEEPTKGLLASVQVETLVIGARPPRSSAHEREFYEAKKAAAARVRKIGPPVSFEWVTSVHDVPLNRPKELAARIAAFARAIP